jgi:hypothetical protein
MITPWLTCVVRSKVLRNVINDEEGENWSWRRWASAAALAGVFAAGEDEGAEVVALSLPLETSVDFDEVEEIDAEDVPLTFDCGRRSVEPVRGEVEEVDVDVAVARGGVRLVANQR